MNQDEIIDVIEFARDRAKDRNIALDADDILEILQNTSDVSEAKQFVEDELL